MNAGIYSRKSRKDEGKASYRLQVQKKELPAFARQQGWEFTIYDEDHASASKGNLANLKERNRLERDIRLGKIDVVLVIEMSRLSRDDSMEDYLSWLTLCAEKKVLLATPGRVLDPSEPSDWMLLVIEGGFSGVEMKILQARMKQGRREAFLAGKWLGGKPPKPYMYDKNTRCITVDPSELSTMEKLWSLAEHNSAKAVAEKMGLAENFVRRSISDERLTFYQGKRIDQKTGDIIEGDWEPVMSPDKGNRIRAARRTRKTNGVKREAASLFSALSLLKCGYCGRSVKTWNNSKVRKDGSRLDYYGCQVKSTKNACPKSRMIPQAPIDERVLKNIFNTIGCLDGLMNSWLKTQGNQGISERLTQLEAGEKRIRQKVDRLVEAVAEGLLSHDEVARAKKKNQDEMYILQAEREDLKSRIVTPPDWDSLLLTREEFDHLDLIDQRRFVSLVLNEVRIYDSYAILTYKFPRTSNGSCTARIHLLPSSRGTLRWRRPTIFTKS